MRTWLVAWLVAVSFVAPSRARAAACTGVARTLTEERKSDLASSLSRQLRVPVVEVLHSFKVGTRSILHVDAHKGDEVFLFFERDPSSARHVTLWSGAATKMEERSIERWALKNAPGIPGRLARCFAWYVTNGRDR
jgi:hypothetical protein